MKYQSIYNNIISNALTQNRKKYKGVYFEKHHILPKCLNGTNDKNNLILLTAKEHFIAHKLLTKIYPKSNGILFAYYAMVHFPSKYRKKELSLCSRDYEYAKECFGIACKSRKVWNKGKTGLYLCSKDTKKKLSIQSKGESNGMFNKKHSEDTKNKIGIKNSGDNNGIRKMMKKDPTYLIGENNHRACIYEITNPDGEVFEITGLREFCRNNGLHHSNMVKVYKNSQKHHKGYKCKKLNKNENL